MPEDERPEEESPEEEKPTDETPEDSPDEAPPPMDEASEEPVESKKPPGERKKQDAVGMARKIGVLVALVVVVIIIGVILYSRTARWQTMRLRSASTVTRINALDKLEDMEEETVRTVLPAVARAVGDTEVPVRSKAANLLRTVGDVGPEVIDELVDILEDPDMPRENKSLVIQSLPELGEAAERAMPALLNIARNDDRADMRNNALQSANRINPDRSELIELALDKFADEEEAVRSTAASIAGTRARTDDETLERIKAKLDAPETTIRQAALSAMQTVGVTSDRALPSIVGALEDEAEAVRNQALNALGNAMNNAEAINKIRQAAGALDTEARARLTERLGEAEAELDD